jgi:hypothetical protein
MKWRQLKEFKRKKYDDIRKDRRVGREEKANNMKRIMEESNQEHRKERKEIVLTKAIKNELKEKDRKEYMKIGIKGPRKRERTEQQGTVDVEGATGDSRCGGSNRAQSMWREQQGTVDVERATGDSRRGWTNKGQSMWREQQGIIRRQTKEANKQGSKEAVV